MKNEFRDTLTQLRNLAATFDNNTQREKIRLLSVLRKQKLTLSLPLEAYNHLLLFLSAHPCCEEILNGATEAREQLAAFLEKEKISAKEKFENSGLPFTTTLSSYSHDLLRAMEDDETVDVSFHSFSDSNPGDVLQFTLPAIEKETTTYGYSTEKLFSKLAGDKNKRLKFLLSEFSRLDDQPFIKDHLFSSMQLYVNIVPRSKLFSITFNHVAPRTVYYHHDLLKHFDAGELLHRNVPKPASLSAAQKKEYINAIRHSLTLLQRETDPSTYMDEQSLRVFELERGITVAIFGITAPRQLPLESYVGYTLFKNGFPAAYGGSWIFGSRALFGINVFESFRGGESGFVLCQLLRVYKNVFGLDYFEVEPYQYGLGNPEGIHSGAFWFYYRYGFRPLDKNLLELAESESRKIASAKGYRSPATVLRQFTQSNIGLQFGKNIPLRVSEIRDKISRIILEKFDGNRQEAEKTFRKNFIRKFGSPGKLNKDEQAAFAEMIYLAEALDLKTKTQGKLLMEMIRLKPVDLYGFQERMKKIVK